jgi:hypothetical protein
LESIIGRDLSPRASTRRLVTSPWSSALSRRSSSLYGSIVLPEIAIGEITFLAAMAQCHSMFCSLLGSFALDFGGMYPPSARNPMVDSAEQRFPSEIGIHVFPNGRERMLFPGTMSVGVA